jgi:hypothetical protein
MERGRVTKRPDDLPGIIDSSGECIHGSSDIHRDELAASFEESMVVTTVVELADDVSGVVDAGSLGYKRSRNIDGYELALVIEKAVRGVAPVFKGADDLVGIVDAACACAIRARNVDLGDNDYVIGRKGANSWPGRRREPTQR